MLINDNDNDNDVKKYLMIENQGIVSQDLLTIIGASTARYDEDSIGLMVAVLLSG